MKSEENRKIGRMSTTTTRITRAISGKRLESVINRTMKSANRTDMSRKIHKTVSSTRALASWRQGWVRRVGFKNWIIRNMFGRISVNRLMGKAARRTANGNVFL